ncbi:MAG: hypothetical protein IIC57_00975 [Proteobacteria bacterium]|nr:hypothetical protein [Pseudomonadota bacterium]
MSIIKRDFLRKTLIALGAAAAIGGATASTGYADAVSGFDGPALVASPTSVRNAAVATNPGGPRAAMKPGDPDAAKDSGTTEFPWDSVYADN